MNVYVQCDICSCPIQKGQLGPGTLGGELASGLSRDVWSCPVQKGQLGPGTLGGELASGLSRDVCGCPVQKGQLGPGTLGGELASGLSRDVWSCPIQKGQLGPGTLGGELASGLSRDVWSCPVQKGQLGPGTLGSELASGLSRDVWSCPVQKGQLGPQRQSHIRLGVKDDLGISLFPGIPQRQLWHFMAILDHPVSPLFIFCIHKTKSSMLLKLESTKVSVASILHKFMMLWSQLGSPETSYSTMHGSHTYCC